MSEVLLAIDAGGSHTRAVIAAGSEVLGSGLAGPANWTALGPERCAAAMAAAAGQALREARLQHDRLTRGCVSLAGYYPPRHAEEVRTALAGILPRVPMCVVPDLVAGWTGATGGEPGIVLTAGTGAVAYGRDARGQAARAGGWGPLMGDEGGGYWIGVEVLRAIGRALDGRGPSTSLAGAILSPLAAQSEAGSGDGPDSGQEPESVEAALRSVYRDAWSRERIAALSETASRQAAAGDPVALEIFERAARELGSLIEAVTRRLASPSHALPISLVGGLTEAGGVLWDPLTRWVAAVLPGAQWRRPLGTPLDGALCLARQEGDG